MENVQYRLAIDGDRLEKYYWGLFIQNYFPSYEVFWQKYTVPLTKRPDSIHFRRNEELSRIGKSENDLCIAQLAYSAVINLGHCFEILNKFEIGQNDIFEQRDLLIESFARLIGAQDNIFELLERKSNPVYKTFNTISGKTAKDFWQNKNGRPLELIRKYRNNLIHGGIHSAITGNVNQIWFMKVGTEGKYQDWRIVTNRCEGNEKEFEEKVKPDFILPFDVLKGALEETIKYFEDNFKKLI